MTKWQLSRCSQSRRARHGRMSCIASSKTCCIVGMSEPTFEAFPPKVVGQGELEQRCKDEGRAGAHPNVNGLKLRLLYFPMIKSRYLY